MGPPEDEEDDDEEEDDEAKEQGEDGGEEALRVFDLDLVVAVRPVLAAWPSEEVVWPGMPRHLHVNRGEREPPSGNRVRFRVTVHSSVFDPIDGTDAS